MDSSDFHRLVGRAMTDPAFLEQLKSRKTRKKALKEVGIKDSPEVEKAIDDALASLGKLSGHFGSPVEAA